MQISLLAPFRTQLQLDTEYCLSNWEVARETISASLAGMALPLDLVAKGPDQEGPRGFQKYVSLNTDYASPFVRPLATLTLPESGLEASRDRYFASVASAIGAATSDLHLRRAQIFIHDNTIAMAQFDIEIAADAVDSAQFVGSFDVATSLAARAFLSEIGVPAVERVAKRLATERLAKVGNHLLLLPPSRFIAFDDVSFEGRYAWPEEHSALLWVNRTMSVGRDESAFHEAAAAWGRLNGQTKHALAQDHYVSVKPGNNLLLNSDGADDLLTALRLVQYFYIIFDTFSDRLKRFYVSIGPWRNMRSVTHIHQRAARISSFFDYARTEFNDLMIGLQSERKHFAEQLVEVFEMDQLIANVKDRHVAVESKIAALLEIRGQTRQKVLQFGIVLIGALQIFDLLLNISWFALTEPQLIKDDVPSIFSLGLNVSPNLVQNVALLVVLITALIVTTRRRT